ncbi:hypothetical protein ETH_00031275 [Eimeria tenella]|uniref:Uncharacterized protein n=1 Tax=Eimeria tenella TaxID=5802 RepID=U6L2Z1_EIMTE|nr:hypothetical protein ETH_00031275 [Eimeria tenella]CDJ42959.1 hypothetical protein ETH_00031275 [Eimeria tenella]|eukprot:XP_013233709.1 hypothetical protein ETH_00031275 [Eimeria tenella]
MAGCDMVVMRMQNVSEELGELWDADAPQSMNADVQGTRKTGHFEYACGQWRASGGPAGAFVVSVGGSGSGLGSCGAGEGADCVLCRRGRRGRTPASSR